MCRSSSRVEHSIAPSTATLWQVCIMAHDDRKTESTEKEDEPLGLDPSDAEPPAAQQQPARKADVEPLELEELESSAAPRSGRTHTDDESAERCPNCGAPMPADALVCLRCGYDLKSLEAKRTRIEKPQEVDEEAEAEKSGPVSRPGRGDLWLPLAMAAISGAALIIGYLVGAHGLYPGIVATTPQGQEVAISIGQRFLAVLQFLVLIGMMGVCGLAGLFLVAQAMQRPVGDMPLAVARMLGIVTAIRLVTFLQMPGPRWVEWLTESVIQAAAFIGLSILLYTLKPRNGAMMGVFALAALVALWLFARAMVWALEGGV